MEYLVWQSPDDSIGIALVTGVMTVPSPWRRWQLVRVDSQLAALRWAMKRWTK